MVANTTYYLNISTVYWTMTPSTYSGTNAREWVVFSNGSLNPNANVTYVYALRPVITISKNILYQDGDGSAGDPYIVE